MTALGLLIFIAVTVFVAYRIVLAEGFTPDVLPMALGAGMLVGAGVVACIGLVHLFFAP